MNLFFALVGVILLWVATCCAFGHVSKVTSTWEKIMCYLGMALCLSAMVYIITISPVLKS